MQGGSLCENAPNLRIDTDECRDRGARRTAPDDHGLGHGDWTRNTWIEEYPAIRAIYQLFRAEIG
jgi:hypothetical protein